MVAFLLTNLIAMVWEHVIIPTVTVIRPNLASLSNLERGVGLGPETRFLTCRSPSFKPPNFILLYNEWKVAKRGSSFTFRTQHEH